MKNHAVMLKLFLTKFSALGRASRGVVLFTTGTPHIRVAEILSGFLAYVP